MGVKDSFLKRLLASADTFSDKQIAQTVDVLLEHGISHHASDIHIEPHEKFLLVRYRIDGRLHGTHKLPLGAQEKLLEHLKTRAEIQASESVTPREGQFELTVDKHLYDVRLTTMPVLGGEKAVLHISRQVTALPVLGDIGFWGHGLAYLNNTLAHPHGLVLISGPRHQGVRATFHGLIKLLHTPSVSIASIEEPLDKRIPGINQIEVNPKAGVTFLSALQTTLRQDPNIIALDQLPDHETAAVAVQAATTGHFVIAASHADTNVGSVTRLIHMGIEPFLLASTLRAAVNQVQVRALCATCKERYALTPAEATSVAKRFTITSPAAYKQLHALEQQAAEEEIGEAYLSTTTTKITHLWQRSEDGCERCDFSGFRGIVTLTEVLPIDETVRAQILKAATTNAIHAAADKSGFFVPLHIDGLVKALRGLTSLEEVLPSIK